MKSPKLAIVIHAEEEFDWDSGFYRSNTSMTHDQELISLIDTIIELGGKVTLAMDYPFIASEGGKRVVEKYKGRVGEDIEFATHLHPWVNPPFEDDNDQIENEFSYPGNLSRHFEYQKLNTLTDQIEKVTGTRPVTYLAGRYGIGENTTNILNELGYKVDLSVSAYCDFTHQQGPDFSCYTNQCFSRNQVLYFPHTCSIVSFIPFIDKSLNLNPTLYSRLHRNKLTSLVGKVLRISKFRLSPEGFSFKQMKRVTESQMRAGQREFILSFHSPSAKVGLTPYVRNLSELEAFKHHLFNYIEWFNLKKDSSSNLPQQIYQSKLKELDL